MCKITSSLAAAFAEAAERFPGHAAISDGDRVVSYAELEELSARLAAALMAEGVAAGSRVGVSLTRGWLLPVTLVGVLRAGCCYVPLDPGYPAARTAFIVSDSEPAVILTDDPDADPGGDVPVLPVQHMIRTARAAFLPEPGADDLAYIIYTSGSTGTPKGVPITHGNVLSLFRATSGLFGFGPSDGWTLFHSYSFDFSVWELWGALLHGGRGVVVPAEVARDPARFWALLDREQVTVLNQVPSVFAQMMPPARRPPLRWLIFGGEAMDRSSTAAFVRASPDTLVVNMYGITETTIHTTFKLLSPADLTGSGSRSPIGTPLPHLDMELRGADGRPVTAGEIGEIYVRGAGVADGYWRRPELTAERFVTDSRGRWYRSGDLARRLPSGEYHYCGRNDAQLKVHGFRIEAGEVEAAFAGCPFLASVAAGVEQAPDGGTVLVLYYVPGPDAPAGLKTMLRRLASEVLPRHMRPTRFCAVRGLPLTPSGKLDRHALPAAATASAGAGRAGVGLAGGGR
jgi:amino acid adenylation domain-containing protein